MIGAGISYYGSGVNYLTGNAKIYDGSFDCDTISSWAQLNRTSIFSFNIALNSIPISIISSGTFSIFSQGRGTTTQHFTIRFVRANVNDYRINISMQNSGTNRINKNFIVSSFGRDVYNITYDGSSTAAGLKLYKNGTEIIGTVVADNLTLSIISTDTNGLIGAFRGATSNTFFMNGFIRQLEIINRVATPAEIASASATGSFQGAGTVSNAEYLLAVDFDKTGAANLTTRASTPTYTITALGGAAYTQYLP